MTTNSREYIREYMRKRKAVDKEFRERTTRHSKAAMARLKAKHYGLPSTLTSEDIDQQFKEQGGRCFWCGTPITRAAYHIDHKVPFSKGGKNIAENLVCTCASCNLRKGAKMPSEWVAGEQDIEIAELVSSMDASEAGKRIGVLLGLIAGLLPLAERAVGEEPCGEERTRHEGLIQAAKEVFGEEA